MITPPPSTEPSTTRVLDTDDIGSDNESLYSSVMSPVLIRPPLAAEESSPETIQPRDQQSPPPQQQQHSLDRQQQQQQQQNRLEEEYMQQHRATGTVEAYLEQCLPENHAFTERHGPQRASSPPSTKQGHSESSIKAEGAHACTCHKKKCQACMGCIRRHCVCSRAAPKTSASLPCSSDGNTAEDEGEQQQQQKAGTPKKKLKGNCKGFTFPKKPCTQCGKMVASSYMQRHLKRCTESNRPGPSRANLKPRTMHVVDKIDAHRVGPDGKIEYKVRWQGYSPNDDTWEKKVNMDCEELITAYEEYGICYRIYNF